MKSHPNDNLLLAIESASSICSVALFQDKLELGEISTNSPRSHNEKLAMMVSELLKKNSVNFDQIANIAVSIGPGSFTGLRVGLSFAKGIALVTDCKIIPVDTLKALAITIYRQSKQLGTNNNNYRTVLAATVARKLESFAGLYQFEDDDEDPISLSDIIIINTDDLSTYGNCIMGGEGIYNLMQNIEIARSNGHIVSNVNASASAVGYLALKSIMNEDDLCDAFSLEPKYVNDFTVHRR